MLPRTQRQKEVLDYITRFLAKHGHQPSYAQIARHFGVSSKATIAKHVAALEKRGLIKREHKPGIFELGLSMEEVPADAVCEVRLVGRIAAGVPIDAIEDPETICVPRLIITPPQLRLFVCWIRVATSYCRLPAQVCHPQ